jgi:hypothetical protein
MDLSFWNNLNSDIQIQNTSKKYFNEFLWKLVIHAEGGRLIDTKSESLSEALKARIDREEFLYSSRIIWNLHFRTAKNADLELLQSIKKIKKEYSHIKVRVEEPSIQFYTQSEDILKEIAQKLKSDCMIAISGPKDKRNEELLNSGHIIRKKETPYRYKIHLRDGRFDPTLKIQLLHYLENLGDEVKISAGVRRMLSSDFSHSWGVWFYATDPSVTTFIHLFDPTWVSNIHELVVE